MAVVIETTLGDITVDLYISRRPMACMNFLKLCKMKYYNYNLFHTVQASFIAQTGDPTGVGDGGESIFGLLYGVEKRFFQGESMPKIRHTEMGTLSMVSTGENMLGSQFFITLDTDLTSLDGQHCVIGEVSEGHEVLRKLNEAICDSAYRPYQDIRITHTVVLEDPFDDPKELKAPSRSPSPSEERLRGGRIAPDEDIDDTQGKTEEEINEMIQAREAKARATILEIVGDIPDADIAPPENVLFVCKLNPVTTDDDLEIIFSRFGKINSCEVIRDRITGDSLQYAFIEFDERKSCEDAFFKMDNVLIDDRRIHVDFSQSVSKIRWKGKGRGVIINDEKEDKDKRSDKEHVKKELKHKSDRKDNDRHGNNKGHNRKHDDYKRGEKQFKRDDRSRYEKHDRYKEKSRSNDDRRYDDRRDRYDRSQKDRHDYSSRHRSDRVYRRDDRRLEDSTSKSKEFSNGRKRSTDRHRRDDDYGKSHSDRSGDKGKSRRGRSSSTSSSDQNNRKSNKKKKTKS